MPSPLARLDGDSTRLACGSVRHQAPSTSSPKAVSAPPYGRGLTSGSCSATPWAMTGSGCGAVAVPHPARPAARSSPAAIRNLCFMRMRRPAAYCGSTGWRYYGHKTATERMAAVDSAELRSVQQPLKDAYREHPDQAVITLRADGRLEEQAISCSVATGQALTVAGLHSATGGDGSLACSGDMLLQALVACAGVTLRAVATSLGIEVTGGTVSAEGDLDFRG